MGDHVEVDVTELHHTGHQIANWHLDTERAFTDDHQAIEESVASGWVGSSADAMNQRLQSMRAAGTAIAYGCTPIAAMATALPSPISLSPRKPYRKPEIT